MIRTPVRRRSNRYSECACCRTDRTLQTHKKDHASAVIVATGQQAPPPAGLPEDARCRSLSRRDRQARYPQVIGKQTQKANIDPERPDRILVTAPFYPEPGSWCTGEPTRCQGPRTAIGCARPRHAPRNAGRRIFSRAHIPFCAQPAGRYRQPSNTLCAFHHKFPSEKNETRTLCLSMKYQSSLPAASGWSLRPAAWPSSSGAALVTTGETVVLATAVASPDPGSIDFFP